MTATDLVVLAASGVVAVVVVVLLVLLVRLGRQSRRTADELRRTRAEAAELAARVETLGRRAEDRPATSDAREFVITRIGETDPEDVAPVRLEGRLFADLVLRESAVKAAALAHGVRRALAPETRNRIRFEMRRDLRRSRRRRRADLRDLRRGPRPGGRPGPGGQEVA